jgi:replicative DNA helicase
MTEIANLPHNVDIERVVLSTLLSFGDYVRRVDLPSEVFHIPRHKQAYELMLEMAEEGDPIAYVSFKARLVLELTDPLPSTKHVCWYAERLRRYAYQRSVMEIERKAFDIAQQPTTDPDGIESVRDEAIREARERYWPPESASEPDEAREELRAFYQRCESLNLGTGFPSLDQAVGEIHPATVITILARPGVGKSVLGLNLVSNWLHQNADWGVMFCSLEMGRTLATDRLIRIMEGWTVDNVKHAMRSGKQPAVYNRLTASRYSVFAQPGQPLPAIETSLAMWERRHGRKIRAVVVDYFQYLKGETGESPYQKASRLSRELKEFAKRRDCLVVNLCQVSRGKPGGEGSKCPSLEAARDSGTIEENADVLIGMWRPKPDDPTLMLKVVKARQGIPGRTAELLFDPETMRLSDGLAPRAVA